jgi:hypothetical protein
MKQTAILIVLALTACQHVRASEPRAVRTFECAGLYWKADGGGADRPCSVRFRPAGEAGWREALPLWFDKRNKEYRGSIVGLKPGTLYDVELLLEKAEAPARLQVRTWPESFPVARTVKLKSGLRSAPLVITKGGSSKGYVLYEGSSEEPTVIDVANKHRHCVEIRASYVIVRGLTLKNAQRDGVRVGRVHDVVIERCDISGWGRRVRRFGKNLEAGIRCERGKAVKRLIVQRNRIHDPRCDANAWHEKSDQAGHGCHPTGPQGLVWDDNAGNHVIRYNEITGDDRHCFNDGMGGVRNFTSGGFPGPDSDVYGNIVRDCNDDGLEIEGGGRNVRVWGNFIDKTMGGIATATCWTGPLYVFRNVFGRSRWHPYPNGDSDALFHYEERPTGGPNRGFFAKVAQDSKQSGRQYWFHNTMLQPPPAAGRNLTLGARWGLHRVGGRREKKTGTPWGVFDFVSLNNIWHVARKADEKLVDHFISIEIENDSPGNTFDYDLYNGAIKGGYQGVEEHGIRGVPVYVEGRGPAAADPGQCRLAPGSPGLDGGKRIPNFNDGFKGKAPDIGAHETGGDPIQFGVEAYLSERQAVRREVQPPKATGP